MDQATRAFSARYDVPALPRSWRPRGLVICHLLALTLLASWLWEPTRIAWDVFDDRLFVGLNQGLADSHSWAALWALLNLRPMDVVMALAMICFVARAGFIFPARRTRGALFAFAALVMLAFALRFIFDATIVKTFDLTRASPSLMLEGAVRLSELFPDWSLRVKDASVTSFPGDHASIELVWALLLSFFARGWKLFVVWLVAVVLMLPRLVAGAHWGSDDLVGGLVVALLSIGWGCYTPYAAWAEHTLERLTAAPRARIAALPMLRRLAVMR